MTPPNSLLDKGTAIEEWIDLRFFRPLGLRLVRLLATTRVTADQVTLACLLLGLVGGHLFLYQSVALNALGLALLLGSDVLDSADGQLARLRGTASRFGAILDGISDSARFINLSLHLLVRALASSSLPAPVLVLLALAALASQALQASVADFLRQVYLYVTTGKARLDLPEDLVGEVAPTPWARLVLLLYRPYVARQARWCPSSCTVIRELRRTGPSPRLGALWAQAQAAPVTRCWLIAQNIRFLVLAATALVGWPEGYFWVTIGPLNLALIWVLVTHERGAARVARAPDAGAGFAAAESTG